MREVVIWNPETGITELDADYDNLSAEESTS